jgi:membrane associated rhomboid family serine protease
LFSRVEVRSGRRARGRIADVLAQILSRGQHIESQLSVVARQNPVVDWLLAMLQELPEEDAPVTYWLIGIITGVFIIEIGMTRLYGLPRIQVFSTGLFGVYPTIAWTVSPILHRDPLHWFASVVGLVFLGAAVERHWARRRYLGFLLIAGYGATAAGVVSMRLFTDSQLAYYGTSGIVFALAGFALVHLPWSHLRVTKVEWFGALVGGVALLQVIFDPFTGPYLHPGWINGGHLAGFVIGALAGRYNWSGCDLR